MRYHITILLVILALISACAPDTASRYQQTIPLISWGGIPADKADTLFALGKECGFDMHLGLYSKQTNAMLTMDAAERAGMGIIINFPQLKDSTESVIPLIKNHPALVAYHIKDEPVADDMPALKELIDKISLLDSSHPCYVNLLPNWSWGVDEYVSNIDRFASEFDLPFYSFDHYPIVEVNGEVKVRPEWYRNLEEFSAMARSHGKPFWAFALATSHSITVPQIAHYPEPTLGQIRLQVFSNLLYGAQAIQYFTYAGLVDVSTCTKKPLFDIVQKVNSQVKSHSHVFHGCQVRGVWHTGDSIPSGTEMLSGMPHRKVKQLKTDGNGAVVSLIENDRNAYLAVQNRDCENRMILEILFKRRVKILTGEGEKDSNGEKIEIDPGDVVIFRL